MKERKSRKKALLEAARAGIRRYTDSSRGANLLGAQCSVRIEGDDEAIVVKCKDGMLFRLEFTS